MIPGSGRSSGEGNDNPLQYSCLENPMVREACSPWGGKELNMTERLTHLIFPVFRYGYESWTIKKAERRRIDAFELCCLRRFPWTTRRSNQSILMEINPEYSLGGLMLKLKLQYFDRLMQRADPLEETLTLGKIEGKRRSGQQRIRWLDGITDSMDMSLTSSGS